MSPTPRELVLANMRNEETAAIPTFCQLAIGHTLLNTGVDPVAFNFSNEGFSEGLLKIRERYDFDGILIHKPGRNRAVIDEARVTDHPDGRMMEFPDGGRILCPANDDPKYFAPEGWRFPSLLPAGVADPIEGLRQLDLDDPIGHLPPSYRDWSLHKGLQYFKSIEAIPEYYYGAIDTILAAAGERYSVHGEVKAPTDYLVNIMGIQEAMLGFMIAPDLMHEVLEKATPAICNWAVAQLRRGVDAIKISSPYAGGGFISRETYKEFVVPYERALVRAIHDEGGIVYTHTCGAIGDRLDLMVDTEIDGIETLDPPPLGDTDLAVAKEQFGDRIFFKGNLDSVNVLLMGDETTVRRKARQTLEIGAAGGGFILSSACSVAPGVPPGNLLAMVDECRRFSAERGG